MWHKVREQSARTAPAFLQQLEKMMVTQTAAPLLLGDRLTATKQGLLYKDAMANTSSLTPTEAYDMRQLATHAQAWLVLLLANGERLPVPVKMAGYDCPISGYPLHRRTMRGSRAAQLIAKWAAPVDEPDPAFDCVRKFCAKHGVEPRDNFRVLVAKDEAVRSEAISVTKNKDQTIADLILAVLPHLSVEQRARVADGVRHF